MHFMLKDLYQSIKTGETCEKSIHTIYIWERTYCAQENALSRASRLPPVKGGGGLGS